MYVTFFRSSSIGTHIFCQHRYFLEYNMGFRSPANMAADKGTVVHKALECLAWLKKCKQESISGWEDDALGTMSINDCDPINLLRLSYNYYEEKSGKRWGKWDWNDCEKWLNMALTFDGKRYDPRNRIVIDPEKAFDFEIKKDWAKYEYDLPNGKHIEGYLGLKGVMDLITEAPGRPGVIEIIDWKTGQRKDWASGKKKTFEKLCEDPQLMLYHYAASHCYPEAKLIFITIYFIKDGGPYTIPFGPEHLAKTEEYLKGKFDEIRATKIPLLNPAPPWSDLLETPDDYEPGYDWKKKCKAYCHFGKELKDGTNKTLCEFYKDEVKENGIEETIKNFGDISKLDAYQGGGGKQDLNVKGE